MKVSINKILEAIKRSQGIVKVAADQLGMSRQALTNRISRSEKLKKAVENARQIRLDFAESRILRHMNSDNEQISLSATKYFLSTMGKERGYYTKIEKEEKIQVPVNITYKLKNQDNENKK